LKAIKTNGYGPVTAVAGTNEFRAVLRLAFLRTHSKLTEGKWAEFSLCTPAKIYEWTTQAFKSIAGGLVNLLYLLLKIGARLLLHRRKLSICGLL
jgi:hypothetical protein